MNLIIIEKNGNKDKVTLGSNTPVSALKHKKVNNYLVMNSVTITDEVSKVKKLELFK